MVWWSLRAHCTSNLWIYESCINLEWKYYYFQFLFSNITVHFGSFHPAQQTREKWKRESNATVIGFRAQLLIREIIAVKHSLHNFLCTKPPINMPMRLHTATFLRWNPWGGGWQPLIGEGHRWDRTAVTMVTHESNQVKLFLWCWKNDKYVLRDSLNGVIQTVRCLQLCLC